MTVVICPRCRGEHRPTLCPRVLTVKPLEWRLAEIARLTRVGGPVGSARGE